MSEIKILIHRDLQKITTVATGKSRDLGVTFIAIVSSIPAIELREAISHLKTQDLLNLTRICHGEIYHRLNKK